MEKRYDLYGDLELPARGTLGPALQERQLATEELWRRISDLDHQLRDQVRVRSQGNTGGLPQLSNETAKFFDDLYPQRFTLRPTTVTPLVAHRQAGRRSVVPRFVRARPGGCLAL